MTRQDHYMQVAVNISNHLNAYRKAFTSYNLENFNTMIKEVAGQSARIEIGETFKQLESALLQRGFLIFPKPGDSPDGYYRVIRANSILSNLLNALTVVGPDGDSSLARLLVQLKQRPREDFLDEEHTP